MLMLATSPDTPLAATNLTPSIMES
jgi:hypothetical protein